LKDSYLTAGIRLGRLLQLLNRNHISPTPKILLRIAFLLQSASWSSLFALIENLMFSGKLKNVPVPDDPVFIIGHWRTGSTLLHQLMNLDPNFAAPTLFQVAVPDSFLVSYPYYRPVFKRLVGKHRPMDRVRLGMDEPQEDEYAIYRITGISPLEDLVFPKSKTYFLIDSDKFNPNKDQLPNWQKHIVSFYKKLYFKDKRRIISKNPFNSFRIPLLHQIFPGARFIHIHRHPCEVVPSTIHMWDIVQRQNCLNTNAGRPAIGDVLTVMDKMLTSVNDELQKLPAGSWVAIGFDAMKKDPVTVLQRLYLDLGLPFSREFEENIRHFYLEIVTFDKNDFSLTAEEYSLIRERMHIHMERYGYS